VSDDFLSQDEIGRMGLAAVGRNVQLSRHALLFAPERIAIGDHSRIDAFCVLSAGERLAIGRNVHISAHAAILGQGAVEIGAFVALGPRCTILSSNDDFSGDTMANPTVPERFRGVTTAPVVIERHVMIGAGSVVLAGVTIGESAVVGALSLVRSDVAPFAKVAGAPARQIGERRRGHLELADRMLAEESG
jgi:galactoside O-acetyltransferase